jgi:hypothetical protein
LSGQGSDNVHDLVGAAHRVRQRTEAERGSAHNETVEEEERIMKRHACHISLIAALLAAPAAWAGPDIVKCVDGGGHVTLTDQPCADGAAGERLATGNEGGGAPQAASATVERYPALEHYPAVDHHPAPRGLPRSAPRKTPEAKPVKLSRDALTLKEARAQMLLLDEARGLPQPKLAGLD